MTRNISDEIDLDKELEGFLLEGSNSYVWEYLVSLENAQNLYPNIRVDMWLQACAFDIVLPQHVHNHVNKHVKMARSISDKIDLDKELEVFLLEGSNSYVWEYLVSLLQVENGQNLYPNISFTIVIVSLSFKYLLDTMIVKIFTIVQLY